MIALLIAGGVLALLDAGALCAVLRMLLKMHELELRVKQLERHDTAGQFLSKAGELVTPWMMEAKQ